MSFRIGIVTDGLEERKRAAGAEIANGGVGVYIYHLLEALRRIDRRNEYVLISYGERELDVYAPDLGGGIRTVALPRTPFYRFGRWLDVPYRTLARSLGLDLIHYPNQFGGGFLPTPPRHVMTLHDLTPLLFPRYHPWRSVLGYRLLLARSLRRADRVIVDSEATRRDVVELGHAKADRVTVIPLGVSPRFRAPTSPPHRLDLPARFLLTVGVLEPRKNHGVLLEALRRLRAGGEEIDLVIVGRDGWRYSDPLTDPAFADVRPRVHVLRNVSDEDLAEIYARATIFAYPSFYEGFGLPVLEAMACGTPVVASDRSSLPEVGGDAALYADPDDAASFVRQILRILGDPSLRERLSAAGRERSAAFTWERTAQRTLEVYEDVCRGG